MKKIIGSANNKERVTNIRIAKYFCVFLKLQYSDPKNVSFKLKKRSLDLPWYKISQNYVKQFVFLLQASTSLPLQILKRRTGTSAQQDDLPILRELHERLHWRSDQENQQSANSLDFGAWTTHYLQLKF